ncbi:MAG: MaoC family dehydratase N-terminal domain-containing protein, partial [Myxococcales bacterium]
MLDRRIIGRNFPPLLNEIEKGAIRRFADSYGDTNPIHRDEEAAKAAGYRNVVAPPTFPATLETSVDFFDLLGIRHRTVLVGEQSFEYHQPICAGDRVVV